MFVGYVVSINAYFILISLICFSFRHFYLFIKMFTIFKFLMEQIVFRIVGRWKKRYLRWCRLYNSEISRQFKLKRLVLLHARTDSLLWVEFSKDYSVNYIMDWKCNEICRRLILFNVAVYVSDSWWNAFSKWCWEYI